MKSEIYLQSQGQEATAWGTWLSKFEWTYFCTFTFAEGYSENGARRAFQRFIQSRQIRPVQCAFFGIERGERYGRIHLHSLLQYSSEHQKPAKVIWSSWFEKYGRCKIEIPDDQTDVSSYCAKYTAKGMVDYDIIGKPL